MLPFLPDMIMIIDQYRETSCNLFWKNETSNRKYYMWCDDIQRVNDIEYSIWWTIGDGFEFLNSCPKSNGRSQFQAQNSCQMRFGQDEESRAVNRMFVENLENERRKDSLKLSFSRGHNWFFWGAPLFFRLETFQLRIYVEIVWILAWSSHESLNVPRVVHDLLVGETSGSSGQQRTCIHTKTEIWRPVWYSIYNVAP